MARLLSNYKIGIEYETLCAYQSNLDYIISGININRIPGLLENIYGFIKQLEDGMR